MAIKLSIDLSDATFAEVAAVIGYAHQLGVDPDEKLNFEGSVLNIEFDGDLESDDLFVSFEDDALDIDPTDDEDGPLYVEDLIDADDNDEYRSRRHRQDNPISEEVIGDIGDAVNNLVQGFLFGKDTGGHGRGQGRGGYGSFGGNSGRPFNPFGPFGPFGPGRR